MTLKYNVQPQSNTERKTQPFSFKMRGDSLRDIVIKFIYGKNRDPLQRNKITS